MSGGTRIPIALGPHPAGPSVVPTPAPTLSVGSAGVQGWVDKAMDAPMAAELTARGGDPSAFRSRRLTIPMLRGAGR